MRTKKERWNVGDLFLVPLQDGTFSLGQIVAFEPEALNSVVCGFYDCIVQEYQFEAGEMDLRQEDLVAMLFTTRDLLDSGDWPIVGHVAPANIDSFADLPDLRAKRFVGAKIVGSGNIVKMMNAMQGLYPWNAFHEPNYLDKLLISPEKKPANPLFRNTEDGGPR